VAPLASIRAEPKASACQWSTALHAALLPLTKSHASATPETLVAGMAKTSGAVCLGPRTAESRASHVLIITGTPYDALPRDGGLEPLCHPCHTAETVRQLYERKQARVDTGTDYHGRKARKRLGLPPIPPTPTPGFSARLLTE
jgi:hypothetical protein